MPRLEKPLLFLLAIVVAFVVPRPATAQISCAPEPPSPPKRISGGEGFPPLPLPATPLRRTERKRAPAPPSLMAKVNSGATKVMVNGKEVWNWTQAPGDMKNLFKAALDLLEVNYKADVLRLNQFSYAPETVPIMYFSAREPLELSETQREAIRGYILKGGAVLGASGNGSDAFSKSFISEMRGLFPNRPWHVLPPDHPVFRSHHAIDKVQYRRGESDLRSAAPHLQGLNIGCRTAIILSPADLSCGWDNHTHSEGFRAMPEDAKRLGVNLLAYALAFYRLGRVSSVPVLFRSEEKNANEIQIGQIVHGGDWDPSPSSLQHFLKTVSEETSVGGGVNYRPVAVDLAQGDLFRYPYLYLTGHLDFALSTKGVENLREYLTRGGFLFVSNCCDRDEFDRAVRRELKITLPRAEMKSLGAAHPVFTSHFSLAAKASKSESLEGIVFDETTCVIYSPGSIASAWDGEPRPFIELPEPETARQLGVNSLVYAMTH